jgi:nicotinamide mononucleotide transporter
MYIVYGGFCVIGFISWLRIERRERAEAVPSVASPAVETVG